jgi:hypothetical protein
MKSGKIYNYENLLVSTYTDSYTEAYDDLLIEEQKIISYNPVYLDEVFTGDKAFEIEKALETVSLQVLIGSHMERSTGKVTW